ncbi:MAG: tyrosine recombinase XerC [Bacilli bacterium]|nr:tyrosine recombinase XerC [Bacilli bacterium]
MIGLINDFLIYLEKERNYSLNTISSYNKDFNVFKRYLSINQTTEIKQIDYKFIRTYLAYLYEKKYSNKSIARMISSLKSFYKYLMKKHKIETNPMNLIKTPKLEKKLPKFLYYDELEQILSIPDINTTLGLRDALILEMFYSTGIRVSEIIKIKINDINFDDRRILITGKGNKERYVLYGTKMEKLLNAYLINSRLKLLQKENSFLLLNRYGNELTDRGIRKILDTILKKGALDKHISPHTLRHTFATHMLDSGADIKIVQELLGHESLSTTQIYTHVSNEKIKDVYYKTHPRASIK